MTRQQRGAAFAGFRPLTSNTTYTPNQLFDVCLRHCSQSAFRLVAYLVRQTLGWVDSDGKPQESRPAAGYADLINRAGISRNRVRAAIDEAVAAGMVRVHRPGRLAEPGRPGEPALYELAWDPRPHYHKRPEDFRGFFEGEGNRTDVPNQYFDEIVPNEPLMVSKVVGAVLRFSIGFQARQGSRRQHAALSLTDIARYARISSRPALSRALKSAIEKGYVVRLEHGVFSPCRNARKKAVYALCWADGWRPAAKRCEKDTSAVWTPAGRCEKDTRGGANSLPAMRCDKDTNIETPEKNETTKPAVAASSELAGLLVAEGVSKTNAETIANTYDEGRIRRQIGWLDSRSATKSRAGLLVRAIEGDWEKPLKLRDLPQHRIERPASRMGMRPIAANLIRERHEARFRRPYLDYLASQEQEIKGRQPEAYGKFLEAREAEKNRIIRFPKRWEDSTYLRSFDGDRARLKALAERFKLMSFWEWDAAENPDALGATINH